MLMAMDWTGTSTSQSEAGTWGAASFVLGSCAFDVEEDQQAWLQNLRLCPCWPQFLQWQTE